MAVAAGEVRRARVTAHGLRRWLFVGVAAVVVTAMAVALWLVLRDDTTSGEAVAGDVVAAWNEPSETLFARAYAEDAVLVDSRGTEFRGRDAIVAMAERFDNEGAEFTRVGPVAENASLVAFSVDIRTGDQVLHDLSMFELDDDGLIVRQTAFGEDWELVE